MKNIFTILLLSLSLLHAQESPVATGSDATGTGGTVNYTVGQIVYTAVIGTNGSVAQGVQQPYEISTSLSVNEISRYIEASVFPNPTTNYLILKVEKTKGLTYQLYDIQGKVIENKKIDSNLSIISLENQPSSTYFLRVSKTNQIVKIFTIIKN